MFTHILTQSKMHHRVLIDCSRSSAVQDPEATKPEDWDDTPMLPDPEATKPDGFDDIPKTIPDPDATKPVDWDEGEDGEWTAPELPNPEYRGEWRAPMIENPKYKVLASVLSPTLALRFPLWCMCMNAADVLAAWFRRRRDEMA